MSFYGNIGDTSQISFQFDKIFSNRKEMDLACANGTDGVYQGRFVLVKYDNAQPYFTGDILYGFVNNSIAVSTNGTIPMFLDAHYQQPYIYTDYQKVSNPIADDYRNYYEKIIINGTTFYMSLTGSEQVTQDKDLYQKINTSMNAVGINTIIYKKDITTQSFDGKFYICVGPSSVADQHDANNNKYAAWKLISNYKDYGNYLSNFQIDANFYGKDFFDYRGYDATVWEKIYKEGIGKYIQIARLNSSIPAIDIINDQPTTLPSSVYIDAKSAPDFYQVHVPNNWGFRFKESTEEDPPSELLVEQEYITYERENASSAEQEAIVKRPIAADVYFNIKGDSHQQYKTYDSNTPNEIKITPTGKSGKKYDEEIKTDTYELSVHLPMVGNMISDGYDLIYGENEINEQTGKILRPRDINWYDGDAGNVKVNGDSSLGGKTYNLNTLAGTLNTMHARLGQNIIVLPNRPDASSLQYLSTDYIYYIQNEDKYYRLGTDYVYTTLVSSDYNYNLANVSEENYLSDTYYTDSNGNNISTSGFNSQTSYYKKSIKKDMYEDITDSLMGYEQSRYFLKRGVDYFKDNASLPSYPDQQYYDITSARILRSSFSGQYFKNTYWYKDENDNYLLDTNDKPALNRDYFLLNLGQLYQQVIFYIKNKFYIKDSNDKYVLCNYENITEAKQHLGNNGKIYWLEFDETIDIIISSGDNGETYIGHPLSQAHEIYLNELIDIPANTNNFYMIENNKYTAFKNISKETNNKVAPANYVIIDNEEFQDNLYVTGKYYYQTEVGDYILSYDNLNEHNEYFILETIIPLTKKFYLPGTYYRETATDYFEIDFSRNYNNNVSYYAKKRLFVIEDYTGRCPYGYEWSNYAVYVPASITLAFRSEVLSLFELKGFDNGERSINGSLLQLEKFLETENLDTRDNNTYRGSLNSLQDYLYLLNRLIPNRIIYINDFGQLTSSSIEYDKLVNIMKKYNQIMQLN